jgi:hypothetical protein
MSDDDKQAEVDEPIADLQADTATGDSVAGGVVRFDGPEGESMSIKHPDHIQ